MSNNGYPTHIKHPVTQEKMINTKEYVLFMKVEMFGTQKSAVPLSFCNFDFLPIYKANSAGSRTYAFGRFKRHMGKLMWKGCLSHWRTIRPQASLLILLYSLEPSLFTRITYGPRHEKTCLCHMRTTKAKISLCICIVWSAPLLFAALVL